MKQTHNNICPRVIECTYGARKKLTVISTYICLAVKRNFVIKMLDTIITDTVVMGITNRLTTSCSWLFDFLIKASCTLLTSSSPFVLLLKLGRSCRLLTHKCSHAYYSMFGSYVCSAKKRRPISGLQCSSYKTEEVLSFLVSVMYLRFLFHETHSWFICSDIKHPK